MSDIGQRLIDEVKRVAGEHPDFRYRIPGDTTQCKYVKDGAPSCLIGCGLWNLGLIDEDFEHALYRGYGINGAGVRNAFVGLGLELDDDEIDWLEVVQDGQDGTRPWGACIS